MSNQNTIIIRAHRQDDQIQLSDQTANIVLLVDVRQDFQQLSIEDIEKRLEDLLPSIQNRISVYIYRQDANRRTMEGPHDIVARHFNLMPKLQEVRLQNVGDYEGFLSDLAKLPRSVESLQMEISPIGPDDELRHLASGEAPLKIKHLVLSAPADIDDDEGVETFDEHHPEGLPKGFELPWNFHPSLESLRMDAAVVKSFVKKDLPDIQGLKSLSIPVQIDTIHGIKKLLTHTGKSLTRLSLLIGPYLNSDDFDHDYELKQVVGYLKEDLKGPQELLPNLVDLHTSAAFARILMKHAPKVTSLDIEDKSVSNEAFVKFSEAIEASLTGKTLESLNLTCNAWTVPVYLPLLRRASTSVSITVDRKNHVEGQENETLADHVLSAEGPIFSSTVKQLTLIDDGVKYNESGSGRNISVRKPAELRSRILSKYAACLENCDVIKIWDANFRYIFKKNSSVQVMSIGGQVHSGTYGNCRLPEFGQPFDELDHLSK